MAGLLAGFGCEYVVIKHGQSGQLLYDASAPVGNQPTDQAVDRRRRGCFLRRIPGWLPAHVRPLLAPAGTFPLPLSSRHGPFALESLPGLARPAWMLRQSSAGCNRMNVMLTNRVLDLALKIQRILLTFQGERTNRQVASKGAIAGCLQGCGGTSPACRARATLARWSSQPPGYGSRLERNCCLVRRRRFVDRGSATIPRCSRAVRTAMVAAPEPAGPARRPVAGGECWRRPGRPMRDAPWSTVSRTNRWLTWRWRAWRWARYTTAAWASAASDHRQHRRGILGRLRKPFCRSRGGQVRQPAAFPCLKNRAPP
jgi:hypothetical protein